MTSRKIIVNKISKINAESIRSNYTPKVIRYLDTSSITRNKIDGIQILDSNVAPFPSRAQRKVMNKTIVYSTVRPEQEHFGFIEKDTEDLIVSTGFLTIDVLDKNIDPKYLYYLITRSDITNYLQTIATNNASTYPSINPDDLGNMEFVIPSDISVQKNIAAVLSALDAKIELNQRINAELESMAKTLYDYWFVQFDFPNEEGKPYKSAGGKVAWNEELKRKIPQGWDKGILSNIGTITGGSTPSRDIDDFFDAKGTAWITPKDLSLNSGKKFITKGETGVSEKGLKASSLNIMPRGTVLLSTRAPIGYMAISREVVTTNQGFKSFIPNKGYSTPYIYYTVQNAIPTIINHSSGSTFKEVSGSVLKEIYICLPPISITKTFQKTVESVFERQNKLEIESQTLTELRDWLLPMLMNGQVTVT